MHSAPKVADSKSSRYRGGVTHQTVAWELSLTTPIREFRRTELPYSFSAVFACTMSINMVDLSDDILRIIFKELHPKDLLNVRQVRHGILTHQVENIKMTPDLQASWEPVALEGHMG